jgi:putative FmdB family regulatory protein
MPFYEYQCKSCGHELEAMQKVSDTPLKKCPHCGKSQLTRLMSAPVFRLKGGGWYETDFKDKDNQRNLADKPEDSKDKSADSKPADDKAEAKTADTKADAATKESSPSKEKAADKPAEKSSGKDTPKATSAKRPARTGSPKKKPTKVKRRR